MYSRLEDSGSKGHSCDLLLPVLEPEFSNMEGMDPGYDLRCHSMTELKFQHPK